MKGTRAAILGLIAVGAVHITQRERHQRQQNEIAVTRIHQKFLTLLTTHPELAALWVPEADPEEEELTPEQYVQLLNANQQIEALHLRHRLGIVRKKQFPPLAEHLMGREHVRKYWARFGSLRKQEASGNKRRERFHTAMNAAYRSRQKDEPKDQPADA
ncbi:DUF6082 family protein [Streptomyces sp. NPDC055299]